MPDRLPLSSDFPSTINITVTPPPSSSPRPTSVLILLHGLGDTAAPFQQLAKQLNLPDTACLVVQGTMPMPFDLGGFHWADDLNFDQATLEMDPDGGFSKSAKMIQESIIEEGLLKKCGYSRRNILFFGLGQGGMVALAVAAATESEFGGVVSLGGPVPQAVTSSGKTTPLLVLGGSSKTAITTTALARIKSVFRHVEYHKWPRPDDGMPRNREEMLPVMRFFARRLQSHHGVPEGSVEIT